MSAAKSLARFALTLGGTTGLALSVLPAQAAYIAYACEQGGDVIIRGAGSIGLAGLTHVGDGNVGAGFNATAYITLAGSGTVSFYGGFMGPTAFGTGSASATTASGAAVGIFTTTGLVVPQGYVSSTSLGLSSSTYAGTTLALLGLTKDTYTWSWGSGATADSFTLVISQAPPVGVPEPATLALIGAGLLGLGMVRRRAA